MSVSDSYKAFLCEMLHGLGPVRVRNMFGGGGVFLDDVMFGLVADETLYLKADATTIPEFETEGMGPFVYEKNGKSTIMSYWQVPDRLLDEPDELVSWAGDALKIAIAGKRPKKKKK